MKLFFIFMDGVGLGRDDPETNPFVRASLPTLDKLLGGNKLVVNGYHRSLDLEKQILHTQRLSMLPLDACLGVDGVPQSASGQASLLTGKNVSNLLGYHDGPKPNPQVMEVLKKGTLFSQLIENDLGVALLNAYPPRYFKSIYSGYKLPGVIALSAIYAGMHLRTKDDLHRGEAISVDFTAHGWRDQLGLPDTPLLELNQAGERLVRLSSECQLAFFEFWLTDIAGHQQNMQSSCALLETFDTVLGILLENWDDDGGMILLTSDHGNLEDLSTRHHTQNDVPLILIGSQAHREEYIRELIIVSGSRGKLDLTDITPSILNLTRNFR